MPSIIAIRKCITLDQNKVCINDYQYCKNCAIENATLLLIYVQILKKKVTHHWHRLHVVFGPCRSKSKKLVVWHKTNRKKALNPPGYWSQTRMSWAESGTCIYNLRSNFKEGESEEQKRRASASTNADGVLECSLELFGEDCKQSVEKFQGIRSITSLKIE